MEGQIWQNNCATHDGDEIYYWHRGSTDYWNIFRVHQHLACNALLRECFKP